MIRKQSKENFICCDMFYEYLKTTSQNKTNLQPNQEIRQFLHLEPFFFLLTNIDEYDDLKLNHSKSQPKSEECKMLKCIANIFRCIKQPQQNRFKMTFSYRCATRCTSQHRGHIRFQRRNSETVQHNVWCVVQRKQQQQFD